MIQVSFAGMGMQSLFMTMQSDSLGRCGCKSTFLNVKCPLRVCHDVNAHLWVCHDANAFHLTQMQIKQRFFFRLSRSMEQSAFKTRFIFQRFFFISIRLECQVHHFCPKNIFYFDLRLSQKLVITVRNLRMGCQLEIK